MDMRRYLLALLEPLGIGDEFVPDVVLAGASAELGLRLRFTARGERLWVDIAPLSRTPRYAARSEQLAFGYRTEGGASRVDEVLGKRLCEVLARHARANEARVLEALRAEAYAEADASARVRRVEVSTLLEPAGLATSYYTLNPYVGCLIGCRFCYAQSKLASLRDFLGMPEVRWGSYVEVRVNAPQVLARELAENTPQPLKFCPIVSDPYQAIERDEEVTRGCLEAIRDAARVWPTGVMTRSKLILRDLDVIADIPVFFGGVSLPTIDDDVRRHFEPRAASIAERVEVLKALRGVGARTVAVVQPMLAGSVEALADCLADNVDSVSIDVLRGVEGAAEDFAAPQYRRTAEEDWQRDHALALLAALRERGIPVWRELPPGLAQQTNHPSVPDPAPAPVPDPAS